MNDPWCSELTLEDGKSLYGGAARNVRIARGGGMARIIADAVQYALDRANAAVRGEKQAKVSRFRSAA